MSDWPRSTKLQRITETWLSIQYTFWLAPSNLMADVSSLIFRDSSGVAERAMMALVASAQRKLTLRTWRYVCVESWPSPLTVTFAPQPQITAFCRPRSTLESRTYSLVWSRNTEQYSSEEALRASSIAVARFTCALALRHSKATEISVKIFFILL